MSSISSVLSSSQSMRPNMFSRIDANADGKVTKDEFVSGRPGKVSESKAAELFAKIDTEGAGSVTEEQLLQGMAANRPSGDSGSLGGNLSGETLAAILQLLQEATSDSGAQTSSTGVSDARAFGGFPSPSELFSMMDTDSNGSVSKEEFLAAKPDHVSEDQASALFDSIDTEGTGSITSEQFANSMPAGGPGHMAGAGAPPPPPPGGGSGGDSEETYDALDTNQDGKVSIDELMAAMSDDAEESDSTGNALLSQLLDAVKAYASYQNIDLDQTSSLLAAA